MKPVDQDKFGFREGNCFSACVASILEMPLAAVPFFMSAPSDEWFDRLQAWLRPLGLYAIIFGSADPTFCPAGVHILSGRSPRAAPGEEQHHSVVARGPNIIHDPHPSRDGLRSVLDFVVLVPLDLSGHHAIAALSDTGATP